MTREELINRGFELFNNNEYDSALQDFISAYELSNTDEKQIIVDALYSSFVEPNLDEFRDAYKKNIDAFLEGNQQKKSIIPDFEDTMLTFYPISDTKYYIYDNEKHEFAGNCPIDLDAYSNEDVEESFDSILFDSICDFRRILPEISNKRYRFIYFVLNSTIDLNYFFCFMLMPGISEKIGPNLRLFENPDELKNFLWETGNYAPRTVINGSSYNYDGLFRTLHEARIASPKKTRPLLTISIPTRNHGDLALKHVLNALDNMYDEEIEVAVSDNGSSLTPEEYEEIRQLSEQDSRLTYKKFPYTATFNPSIEQVLSISNGEFAVLCSDEDEFNIESINDTLQFIFENKDKGGVLFQIKNDHEAILYADYESTKDSFDSVLSAFCINYITAIGFNMRKLKEKNLIVELRERYAENVYYNSYPHCVLFAFLVKDNGMAAKGPITFRKHEGNDEDKEYYEKYKAHYSYMTLENRLNHIKAETDIVIDMGLSRDVTIGLVVEMQERLYKLLYGAYYCHPDDMNNEQSWEECCNKIHYNNLKMWEEPKLRQLCSDEMHKKIKQVMGKYYKGHLEERPC